MNKVTGRLDVINTSYRWTIPNFPKYNPTGIELIKSPIFSFVKNNVTFEWQLFVYILGSQYFLLHIYSHNEQEIKVKFKLSLLNYNNEEFYKCINSFTFTNERAFTSDTFARKNVMAKEQNGVPKDDKITVMCELMDECEEIESTILSKRLEHLDCLEQLLDNNEFTNVEIVLDEGSTLHAHKNLLACKSVTFASMFDAEENEKICRITIEDMNYEACKEMLRFIYVGKVKDLDKVAHQLAEAADRYSITGLKNLSEEFLCKNITLDNVLKSLKVAYECNMSILKENVLAFILANRKLVIKQPGFKLMGNILPTELLIELLCAVVNDE